MIDFPSVLIGVAGVVKGATRVQKYAFLSAMKIKRLQKIDFYDDWEASNYGPFSPKLAKDLEYSINQELVGKYPIENDYGYKVDRFALKPGGETKLKEFKESFGDDYKKMSEIINRYQTKTLSELLQDVYFQFPQYAKNSKIKDEVGRQIYESESYLSKEYDNPDNEY